MHICIIEGKCSRRGYYWVDHLVNVMRSVMLSGQLLMDNYGTVCWLHSWLPYNTYTTLARKQYTSGIIVKGTACSIKGQGFTCTTKSTAVLPKAQVKRGVARTDWRDKNAGTKPINSCLRDPALRHSSVAKLACQTAEFEPSSYLTTIDHLLQRSKDFFTFACGTSIFGSGVQ